MKLSSHLDEHETDSDTDKFLANTVEITKFTFPSKNTTVTTQSIKSNDPELLLSDTDIKHFFKSLLSYIPNTVTRLEDLIKQNEAYLNELNPNSIEYIRYVHEVIMDAKQFGLTLLNVKCQTQAKLSGKLVQIRLG